MDQGLVVRAQRGDQRAFEQLAADAYPRLYRLAQGILRDPAAADDASQQALINVWRNLPALRDPSCYEGWSYRLLVNACQDQVRRRPRWTSIDLSRDHEPVGGDETGLIAERASLEHALTRLSIEHRTVLALHYLLELTPDEIATTLGVPRKSVYSRLERARASLRSVLEAEARPAPVPSVVGGAVR